MAGIVEPTSASIVITGCGWVTPFAAGRIPVVLAAAEDRSASENPAGGYLPVPAAILEPYGDFPAETVKDRGAWMSAVAIRTAIDQAWGPVRTPSAEGGAAPASERIGMVLGCALAGQLGMIRFAGEVRAQSPRFVSPINFPQTVGNYIAGAMARTFGFRGPNVTLGGGDAAVEALRDAEAMITGGRADAVLAGGTEECTDRLASALAGAGTRLSEGACWFVLEREASARSRGAEPLARIVRFAFPSSEPLTTPDGDTLVSAAGCRVAGAVFIEHWIGHSLAAAAPAALAAAIGAVEGCRVPTVDRLDPTMTQAASCDGRSARKVLVIASGADGVTARLEAQTAL